MLQLKKYEAPWRGEPLYPDHYSPNKIMHILCFQKSWWKYHQKETQRFTLEEPGKASPGRLPGGSGPSRDSIVRKTPGSRKGTACFYIHFLHPLESNLQPPRPPICLPSRQSWIWKTLTTYQPSFKYKKCAAVISTWYLILQKCNRSKPINFLESFVSAEYIMSSKE